MRNASPIGQERIQSLIQKPCFSLHFGRYRAATWHDDELDVVWLLAAAIHRSDDDQHDAYVYFEQIERDGRLYPTDLDRRTLREQQKAVFQLSEIETIVRLRDLAMANPNTVRFSNRTRGGLFAEMWAEVIGEVGLLALRLRVRMESGQYLDNRDIGPIVGAVYSLAVDERSDPDSDASFRYFEEYIEWSDAAPKTAG